MPWLSAATNRPVAVCFFVQRPKLREIFAADFRDRVVHHVLVGFLEGIWEPLFIHDGYACRKGKGVHAAVARLQQFMRQATANGTRPAFTLRPAEWKPAPVPCRRPAQTRCSGRGVARHSQPGSGRVQRGAKPPEPSAQAAPPAAYELTCAHHRPVRLSWTKLLKRVLEIDIEHCPNCFGELKIIAAILEQPVIEKILTHLGLQARAPPRAPARGSQLQAA